MRFIIIESKFDGFKWRNLKAIHLGMYALILVIFSCNSESAPDCFQNAGDTIRYEVSIADFTKITVFENVNLVIKQGDAYKVEVETGEFLQPEVSVEVKDDRLLLRNTNDCNLFRAYAITTVFVTAPDINEIRSSTGLKISSDGVLRFPRLNLVSESFINDESETTDGEFDLDVDMDNLTIVVNGIAYFKLRGQTEFVGFTVAAGDARIEAEPLVAQSVEINHRGTNDILTNPQQMITGDISATGNVLALTEPPLVQVRELYKGRLIFKN